MKSLMLLAVLLSLECSAQDEKKEINFGGFIDTYYGFDFNEPAGERGFTTQALRQNEFALNLAYIDVKVDKDHTRGRLAIQAGTSVYGNYSTERTVGAGLGEIMQHIQEAYGGYRLAEGFWLDAGVFLSHIGAESFISKDNWNYTRSLGADFSPYYQAGVRLSYQWDPKWFTSLHIMNGWQNVIENNTGKAVGMQIAFSPSEGFSITYNNYVGQEQGFRFFNNLILKAKLSASLSLSFSSDIGFQGNSQWFVETLLAQYLLSETIALGGRLEYFHDKDQLVVTTGTPNGFQTSGGSMNLDWQPEGSFLFRNEIRTLFSRDAVFTGKSGSKRSNVLFVSSLSFSF